ncbi:hypothetical protein WR25_14818 [Diploscapter pachys]|uniref:tRNA selenocysteine-associated protein 1 n=1 Tax=Diploscapter pachys TaxID=2018661 RepID=A0A2A2L7P4_9BILA|nr:hypothetical protein WR25_14818 [Diploscapter pachys]
MSGMNIIQNEPYGAPLDAHRTLWMGDLSTRWSAEFIAESFKTMGLNPTTIKMTTEKSTGKPSAYCFVEFKDTEDARKAMLKSNGKPIPGAEPPTRFNLSFANDPRAPSVEFNLYANNLDENVDDAELYQIFGKKYPSCRGAKVYRNSDGSSRCIGFIRFCDQKDQELALIEMNHIKIRGQDIQLKLAPLKQRLPRFQINQKSSYSGHRSGPPGRNPPHAIVNPIMSSGHYMQHPHPSVSMPSAPAPEVRPPSPPVLVPIDDPTPEEANNELVENGDVWFEELEESRWTSCIADSALSGAEFCRQLADSRW